MALAEAASPSPAEAGPQLDGCGGFSEFGAYAPLLDRLTGREPVDAVRSRLVEGALAVWSRPGFDTFVSLPRLRFEPFPHQLRAAARVLRAMQGRAILADEVGLGKTIEASLVLSELRLRGLARTTLVLTPAGLVEQWQEELDRKFALPSVVAEGGRWSPPEGHGDHPVVIASIASARRPPLLDAVTGAQWDLVVVDEAHRVRHPRRASGRLARALRARHLILLTATPVENRLSDLYELVTLVRPGYLGTPSEFRDRHGPGDGPEPARDLGGLHARLREVMVRHRRSDVALMLPRRLARTYRVTPTPEEAELYRQVAERVRVEGRGAAPTRAMALRSIARLAGSSPPALAAGLDRQGWHELARQARRLPVPEKSAALLEVVRRHRARAQKVVVFTTFRHTLDFIADLVGGSGMTVARYHGRLSRREKEAAIVSFRDHADVLVTTEAAGEGRNLQFCHAMVNFDLPWNPMKIEQRLGRIHRIGQRHDVEVTNLLCKGTIEERVMGVLESKINLFELVVGELDMILGRVDDNLDFESLVFAAHVSSRDDDEFAARMEALGDTLARARADHLAGRDRTDALVGGEPEP